MVNFGCKMVISVAKWLFQLQNGYGGHVHSTHAAMGEGGPGLPCILVCTKGVWPLYVVCI